MKDVAGVWGEPAIGGALKCHGDHPTQAGDASRKRLGKARQGNGLASLSKSQHSILRAVRASSPDALRSHTEPLGQIGAQNSGDQASLTTVKVEMDWRSPTLWSMPMKFDG